MNSFGLVVLFGAVLIIAAIMLAIIWLTKQPKKQLNKSSYQAHWLRIENTLNLNNPESCHMSILNADKLLDKALKELGCSGKTMGERLKTAGPKMKDLDGIWTAHKLRNKIAHETNVNVSVKVVRQSLMQFKKALKDVGAI